MCIVLLTEAEKKLNRFIIFCLRWFVEYAVYMFSFFIFFPFNWISAFFYSLLFVWIFPQIMIGLLRLNQRYRCCSDVCCIQNFNKTEKNHTFTHILYREIRDWVQSSSILHEVNCIGDTSWRLDEKVYL